MPGEVNPLHAASAGGMDGEKLIELMVATEMGTVTSGVSPLLSCARNASDALIITISARRLLYERNGRLYQVIVPS